MVDSCLAKLCYEAKRVRVCPLHHIKADFIRRKVITRVSVNYDDVANTKSAKTFHHYLRPHYRSKPDHLALGIMKNERDMASYYYILGIGVQTNPLRGHSVWEPPEPLFLKCKVRAGDGYVLRDRSGHQQNS